MKKIQYINRNEIIKIIIDIIEDILGNSVLCDDNLIEILDSLDSVALVMKMEDKFNISIPDKEFDKLFSVKTFTINDLILELKKYGILDITDERRDKINKILKTFN